MKSRTLSYAALAVALGVGGTVLASKIIGNGYKEDIPACKDHKGVGACDLAEARAVPVPAKVEPVAVTGSMAQPY